MGLLQQDKRNAFKSALCTKKKRIYSILNAYTHGDRTHQAILMRLRPNCCGHRVQLLLGCPPRRVEFHSENATLLWFRCPQQSVFFLCERRANSSHEMRGWDSDDDVLMCDFLAASPEPDQIRWYYSGLQLHSREADYLYYKPNQTPCGAWIRL